MKLFALGFLACLFALAIWKGFCEVASQGDAEKMEEEFKKGVNQ